MTRSPNGIGPEQADGLVARRLGLNAYVSVPVTIGRHELFGMLCGAGRSPREVNETVVNLMESFARIIADRVLRAKTESSENRATLAESQLAARARFIAEAEHQLKTPLTALEGLSLTLLDRWEGLSATERVEFHAGIVRNSRLLAHEVEGLLVEARADMRTRDLCPVHLDIGPLLRTIAKAFNGLRSTHHVIADVFDETVAFVDPIAMDQVIGHLLDNAIKYSPNGGLITIRASAVSGSIVIDVIDEGLGLPGSVDVFEPFHRGDLHDAQTPGIGLGLHIVRKLVEAMEGTVSARSNPGSGSTFTVSLPARDL